ncbi:hypothetical protein KFE25_002163 [Diacronema lutheri]|uniref:Fe2OG dioxygenase domain-containing protein n=2 Tax=Diacronema lutheri TaxID=2081491 RepID=A0A8J5XLM9_DIALT|nr:hypothetical protein KFE25_002163 [Diacronema lutheri]
MRALLLVTLLACARGRGKQVPRPATAIAPPAGPCRRLLTRDDFLPAAQAAALRRSFVSRFADPRAASSERFCWDNWHVGDQYNLVRTPAEQFFDEADYAALCEALTSFGQRELGCDTITPPWLSYYVDGCSQALHTDAWHGPFAFVLSLTDWDARAFTGGETMLMTPAVLDFWRAHEPGTAIEQASMFELVEPRFNRLTVFDPRVPHGVREVRGTRDPLKARLVLHGWFTPAQSVAIAGALGEEQVEPALNAALEPMYERLGSECARVFGTLNVFVHVEPSGAVGDVRVLADTLVVDRAELVGGANEDDLRAENVDAIVAALESACFPPSAGSTDVYVPFSFV